MRAARGDGAWRAVRCGGVIALLAAAVVVGAGVGAEERSVEAVGVVPLPEDLRTGLARQQAVSAGIAEAVYRVVAQELPALDGARAREAADGLIGGSARDYVLRFSVREDRGPRPALLTDTAPREYVVLVEALVDVGAVRDRLVAAGLLAPGGAGAARRIRVVLEELPSYAAYEAVRGALLEQLRAEDATPVEFTPGRVVLEVVTRQDGEALMRRLATVRLAGWTVEPRAADERSVRVSVARSN